MTIVLANQTSMIDKRDQYGHLVLQFFCGGTSDPMVRNYSEVQLPRDVIETFLDYLYQRPRVSRLSWPDLLGMIGVTFGDFRNFSYINEGVAGQRHL